MKFLIVNGVNLNLTGLRERSVYGRASLAEINDAITAQKTETRRSFIKATRRARSAESCTRRF